MMVTAVLALAAIPADVVLLAVSPFPPAPATFVVHVLIGAAWIVAGLVAWVRNPTFRTGPLMIANGVLWYGLLLYSWDGSLAVTFATTIDNLGVAVAAHLFVAFPSGRLASRPARLLVAAGYLDAVVVGGLARQLFLGPGQDWCHGCGPNLLLVHDAPAVADALGTAAVIIAIALGIAIAWMLVRRWTVASPAGRWVLGPVLWTGAGAVLTSVTVGLTVWLDAGPYHVAVWASWAFWGLVPVAFLLGLLRARLRRGAVTRLMVVLADLPPADRVRDALADAVGDQTLEVVFWSPAEQRYVGADGQEVQLPNGDPARAVTVLERHGERFGALVHDPFVLEDRELLEAIGAAAHLAITNAHLQSQVQLQVAEVRASRARILEAGDTERRRIERDLHDGAQQRLLGIRLALQLARGRLGREATEVQSLLAEADEEMRAALDELRTLARGIHPAVLTDLGLEAALTSLARRAPVPVDIRNVPSARLPAPIEAAVYFLTAEALANVAKYAHASQVTIEISSVGEQLRVEIADDGIGGAEEGAGSGLSGLRDRLEALGGALKVHSPAGGGTRLEAWLPRLPHDATLLSA